MYSHVFKSSEASAKAWQSRRRGHKTTPKQQQVLDVQSRIASLNDQQREAMHSYLSGLSVQQRSGLMNALMKK